MKQEYLLFDGPLDAHLTKGLVNEKVWKSVDVKQSYHLEFDRIGIIFVANSVKSYHLEFDRIGIIFVVNSVSVIMC